jgi:trans-aconitate 2-methyltransferase
MTEWDADAYRRVSALQRWLAAKSLATVALRSDDRILDFGCGDGAITAEIAARQPRATVLGVDASHAMIASAARTFPPSVHRRIGDGTPTQGHMFTFYQMEVAARRD